MLYSEFIVGTGCKDKEYNYRIYRALEHIYMSDECDVSKEDIYEMGKKLVDNSKTPEEIQIDNEIKAEIEEHKARIEELKIWIEGNEKMLAYWKEQMDKEMVAFYRNPSKVWRQDIKWHRQKIKELKWLLG